MRPRLALGWCQILLTLGIAWTAYMIADSLPYWPINPLLYDQPVAHVPARPGPLPVGDSAAGHPVGRQFPAGAGRRGRTRRRSGRVVGRIYAANTLGAIMGALAVSLVLVPVVGTQQTQRVLLAIAAVSASPC